MKLNWQKPVLIMFTVAGLCVFATGCGQTIFQSLNPTPTVPLTVLNLSPSVALGGTSSLTVTINGSGFQSSSSVTYNGVPHVALLISAQQMSITLNQTDLATPGNYAVSVSNLTTSSSIPATSTFSVWTPISEPTTGIVVGYPPDWVNVILTARTGQPAEIAYMPSGSQQDPANEYIGDIVEDFVQNPSGGDLNNFYKNVADVNLFENSQSYVNFQINGMNAIKFIGVYGMVPSNIIAIQKGQTIIEINDEGQLHDADGLLNEFAEVIK